MRPTRAQFVAWVFECDPGPHKNAVIAARYLEMYHPDPDDPEWDPKTNANSFSNFFTTCEHPYVRAPDLPDGWWMIDPTKVPAQQPKVCAQEQRQSGKQGKQAAWNHWSLNKGDPDKCFEELSKIHENLPEGVRFTHAAFEEALRDPRSELHKFIDTDVERAARKYNIIMMRKVISGVRTGHSGGFGRGFIHVRDMDEWVYYPDITPNSPTAFAILKQAREDIKAWTDRYLDFAVALMQDYALMQEANKMEKVMNLFVRMIDSAYKEITCEGDSSEL